MSRTTARENAYLMLFANQFNFDGFNQESLIDILDGKAISQEDFDFVKETITGIVQNYDTLKEIVSRNLKDYDLSRVLIADRSALILATYELKFKQDTPPKVVINEAINLVKKYSSEKSSSFVNGVLSKIYKEIYNE